ncbi:hypothetical protein DFH07DRAFT_780380 [Mycena maculata]|uniref:Uncharacterized protein n=1 Tax=Mycena maculata TaxID=230809 RepID=A0AAD7I4R9_9AGAR|nr:hypothetical protein DFH07DRAFT_780380 [Mycena maculata]
MQAFSEQWSSACVIDARKKALFVSLGLKCSKQEEYRAKAGKTLITVQLVIRKDGDRTTKLYVRHLPPRNWDKPFQSTYDFDFVVYVERGPYIWMPERSQRFRNLCKPHNQSFFVLKDDRGVLQNSIHLQGIFGNTWVVNRTGHTWPELLQYWYQSGTDSRTMLVATQAPAEENPSQKEGREPKAPDKKVGWIQTFKRIIRWR